MGADGGEQHRIFADVDGRTDGLPAWSADGTRIAFTRCDLPDDLRLRPIPCAVWTVAPNGSGAARIADHAYGPAWSPDGRWIAYARTGPADFTRSVFMMRSDGTCQTALLPTAGRRSYASAAWRPGTGDVKPPAC